MNASFRRPKNDFIVLEVKIATDNFDFIMLLKKQSKKGLTEMIDHHYLVEIRQLLCEGKKEECSRIQDIP